METEKDRSIFQVVTLLIVAAIYPTIFLYLNNIQEVALSQIFVPIVISILIMALLFCITYFMTKEMRKATLITLLFFFLIANYALIEKIIRKILPQLKYWHIVPISIVLLLHIAYYMNKKMKKSTANQFVKILTFVFVGLILMNVITNMGKIGKVLSKLGNKVTNNAPVAQSNEASQKELPNVYYIVLDEYSNFNVLEKYYNYDNSVFKNFLEDKNFNISYNTRNETFSTHIVTTNYLNLDYVVGPGDDVYPYRTNPYLFSLLAQHGYSINCLSEDVPVVWGNESIAKTTGSTVGGDTFSTILLKNTIYYPFVHNNSNNIYRESFEKGIQFLRNSFKGENEKNFTYIHLLAPHVPFVYGQNGEVVPKTEMQNTSDKSYYLNQLIYVTKRIMGAIDEIQTKDPNSIIIIQSDHSMRYIGAPIGQAGEATLEDKVNILNVVYYQGKTLSDIEDQSGVNTLRIVFNHLLGLDMEIVEVPSYEE